MATDKVQYISSQQWTDLFQVSPSQFNITCQLQKEEFLQLSITNSCNNSIAWKLKTNRPGRYMVSPKQGIIKANQHKDCTVVLSKLKEVPDTKKPDKFLIQATKINSSVQDADLPQLWKEHESKHDKKRGVYAYQAVTIKCFLNIDLKSIEEEKDDEPRKTVNIIEDYVSSESTTIDSPSKQIITNIQSKPTVIDNAPSQPPKPEPTATSKPSQTKTQPIVLESVPTANDNDNNNDITNKNTENASTKETISQPQPTATNKPTKTSKAASEEPQYNAQTVEQWRRKAQEYDELFQFTRKTLAQRDELNGRWKAEQEKTRALQKLNRELKEEKKHILSEYNRNRNDIKMDNDETDAGFDNDEDDEKREIIEDKTTRDRIKREKQKQESIREMDEIDRKAEKNSQSGITISIVQIIVTVLLMWFAFGIGRLYPIGGGNEIDNIDDTGDYIEDNVDEIGIDDSSVNDMGDIENETVDVIKSVKDEM